MISHLPLLSFRRISTVHVLRIAPSSLQSFRISRQFSSTPLRRASEDPDVFISAFKHTALFREMADKPEVLQATKDFVKVLQEEGIVVNPDKPPSMFQILSNTKVRQQLMITVTALRDAGIDAEKLKEAYTVMQAMKKQGDS